jgi:fucose 4-O-acetylase-like acetyltransferase
MRIAKWDNAKFLLIFFVVLGHVANAFETPSAFLEGITYFIYIFHMPAFLFLSGLLAKRTIDARAYEKTLPYLVLYIFMKIFRFLVYRFALGKNPGFNLLSEDGVPWFALTLFFCYLITMCVRNWNPVYAMTVFVILGIMAGYDKDLGSFLTGMRLLTLYPFFLAGYYFEPEKIRKLSANKWCKAVSAVIILAVAAYSFLSESKIRMGFLKGKTTYEALDMMTYGGLYRGVYYVAVTLIVLSILVWIPEKDSIFARFGKRSIQVYALHYPIVKVLEEVFHVEQFLARIWPSHYALLAPVLAFVLTIVLSLGIWEPAFKLIMNPGKRLEDKR